MSPRNCRPLALCLALLTLSTVGLAQDGVSTAGAARTRYLGNMGVIPSSREVAVEDFVNYHRHEIGRPKAGEAVALDVRWGNTSVFTGGEAVLQVGLSTPLAHDRQQLRPLNLSLVIDKSGSMADDNKLVRVKAALLLLVSQLRPTDVLSIVVFDSEAQILFPAEKVTDRERVKEIIRGIEPGSSTNLNAGLMLGYQEDLKHFRKDATNRVILLTDGIANRGVTDPKQIAQASLGFNDKGIDLSTIGVGLDLNRDLLSTLAKSGRGLFHFVADSEDIEKVFVKELQSLVSPVAAEPDLEIDFGSGFQLEKVYGYEPKLGANSVKLKLDNMNSGMTEVVLMRFKARGYIDPATLNVRVRLSYFDLDRHKLVVAAEKSTVPLGSDPGNRAMEDSSVAYNYSIALLAQAIRDMAVACESNHYQEAENILNVAIERARPGYPAFEDQDISRTLQIAQKYQKILHEENQRRDIREGDNDGRVRVGDNIVINGDFAKGNTGFISGLDYLAPTENSLWPAGYTIAPRFNSPQLHRLIANAEFAAVRRPNGNEQVLFANAGGTEALVMWSSVVKCKPSTTYRISFQAMSMTPGPEWIPSYEIKAGDNHGAAQPAGAGSYNEVSMLWHSGSATSTTLTIIRVPMPHNCGIVALCNIEMIPVR